MLPVIVALVIIVVVLFIIIIIIMVWLRVRRLWVRTGWRGVRLRRLWLRLRSGLRSGRRAGVWIWRHIPTGKQRQPATAALRAFWGQRQRQAPLNVRAAGCEGKEHEPPHAATARRARIQSRAATAALA